MFQCISEKQLASLKVCEAETEHSPVFWVGAVKRKIRKWADIKITGKNVKKKQKVNKCANQIIINCIAYKNDKNQT